MTPAMDDDRRRDNVLSGSESASGVASVRVRHDGRRTRLSCGGGVDSTCSGGLSCGGAGPARGDVPPATVSISGPRETSVGLRRNSSFRSASVRFEPTESRTAIRAPAENSPPRASGERYQKPYLWANCRLQQRPRSTRGQWRACQTPTKVEFARLETRQATMFKPRSYATCDVHLLAAALSTPLVLKLLDNDVSDTERGICTVR
jgi:hypothetical protein